MSEDKKPKIIFEPGCFDHFDGTQEELDGIMGEITKMFETMTTEEIMAQSKPVDLEELFDEDPELAKALLEQLTNLDAPETTRKLH